MKRTIHSTNSLEEIENDRWTESVEASYLVSQCHQLRKKPLKDFTAEDLRIMIGQNISLDILIPIALQHLEKNILAEGDFYPGDLLVSLLCADSCYWLSKSEERQAIKRLYLQNITKIETELSPETFERMTTAFHHFSQITDG